MQRRSSDSPSLETAARLAVLWRLAMGSAHTLNNALTAILGEASFLRDDRKRDPQVVDACDSITREVERCSRLTRALLARRHPDQTSAGETDLVRLAKDLGRLLAETLGRRVELELEAPDDLILVRGDADSLELMLLGLIHFAAEICPGSCRIRLSTTGGPRVATIAISLRGEAVAADAAERLQDPSLLPEEVGLPVVAARRIAESLGGVLSATVSDSDGLDVRVSLPSG